MTGPEQLRALADAATPGPWRWFGQRKSGMFLGTPYGGRRIVMDFIRQGMRGAQPRFQVYEERDGEPWAWNGLMTPASELAVLEVNYRDDITGIDHPDARLIALAPGLARLAADLADELKRVGHHCERKAGSYRLPVIAYGDVYIQDGEPQGLTADDCPTCALLARVSRVAQNEDGEA